MKSYDLFSGKLITDEATLTLSAIVAFQNDVVLLENGETFRLTEGLANALRANALRDYLKDVRQALERTRPQA